jgi:uncharacterized protein
LKFVLLDTGLILSLLDRRERRHADCIEAIDGVRAPLVTCEAVIAEACYLMRRLPAEAILQNVADGTALTREELSP